MTQIHIISLGTKLPPWANTAVQMYLSRLPKHYFDAKLIEIASIKRNPTSNIKNIVNLESKKVLASIPNNFLNICLDRRGKSVSSKYLATSMQGWLDRGLNIAISIGGPEGFPASHFEKCNLVWSLSDLTMAHPVIRVVLAEQLYRAFSIITGHPYHRGENY